jgi:outer membrane protein assembly factor BamB
MVFVCTGYDTASLLAIRLGGRGDVTGTHVAWKHSQGVPFTPSPVIVDRWLCLVSDNGILTCLDWQTGKQAWRERLGGNFSASPLAVGNLVYCVSEEGVTHVVRVGERCEKLGTPKIKGKTYASLGVSAGRLFLRSDKQLYCFAAADPDDQGGAPAAEQAAEASAKTAPESSK